MKRLTTFTTTMALLFSALALSANLAFAEKASDLDGVKAANTAFYAALSARDIRAMESVWSPNADIQNIGPSSKAVDVGVAAMKRDIQGTFDASPKLQVTAEQIQVRINGSTAWVTCLEKSQRTNKAGESLNGTSFGTSIFENQAGKWLMVYHHASIVTL